jgi:hypothetical protein
MTHDIGQKGELDFTIEPGTPFPDGRTLAKRGLSTPLTEQVARCRDRNENMRNLADEFGVSPVRIFGVRRRYTYGSYPEAMPRARRGVPTVSTSR